MKEFEVLHNLNNWSFERCGAYRLTEEEAKVCIEALKVAQAIREYMEGNKDGIQN